MELKKYIFLVWFLVPFLALTNVGSAPNSCPTLTFTVVGGMGEPGSTNNIIPITLKNKVAVSEIQFDVVDAPDFLTVTGGNITSRTSGFNVSVTPAGRVSLSNNSGLVIDPGEGAILDMVYDVSPNANVSVDTLKLQNVIAYDANQQLITDIGLINGLFIIPNPVPVELVSLSALAIENKVELYWSTASETNNYGFEIERSETNHSFHKIGFVKGQGTSSMLNQYQYTDVDIAPGTYYYRLKQIDTGGSFYYSEVRTVTLMLPTNYLLGQNYPNPFAATSGSILGGDPETIIGYQLPQDGWVTLKVFNLLGQEVKTLVDEATSAGFHNVLWDGRDNTGNKVSPGIYLYCIAVQANSAQQRSFVDTKKLMYLK